jgi:hypothetical protein
LNTAVQGGLGTIPDPGDREAAGIIDMACVQSLIIAFRNGQGIQGRGPGQVDDGIGEGALYTYKIILCIVGQ